MAEQETVDKVIETLEGLGGQLKETTGQALEVYTRQAFIEGVHATVLTTISFVVFIGAMIILYKCIKKFSEAEVYVEDKYMAWGCISVIVVVITFTTFVAFSGDVLQLFNPEYYAIQELIEQVR